MRYSALACCSLDASGAGCAAWLEVSARRSSAATQSILKSYATRGTDPGRWYPSGTLFDDTPARYRALVDTTTPPYDRGKGDSPALTDDEVDAIVAFLGTLTDRRL